jgi:hypothetical protein
LYLSPALRRKPLSELSLAGWATEDASNSVDERTAGAVVVMDVRQWDVHQFNPSASHKRPRDVDSMSTEALTAVNGYNNQLRECDPPEGPEWKRQRHSSQPNASVWDTSVQTSLWLAQQNNLAPIASMSREENSQSCQTHESEQAFSRDNGSLSRAPVWSRRVDEIETAPGQEGRGLGVRECSRLANPGEFI